MASAQGRVLNSISGSIENGNKHWGQVRNGKQMIVCRRSTNLDFSPKTDAQKTAVVNFFNDSRIARILALYIKSEDLSVLPNSENGSALTITAVFSDIFGTGVMHADVVEWFKNKQVRDENGTIEHKGEYACAYHYLMPRITETRKQTILEACGFTYFEPTAEGYAAFKASKADSALKGIAG